MKKIIVLVCVFLLLFPIVPSFAADSPYEVVIPLTYHRIVGVNDSTFIEEVDGAGGPKYNLYTWDGEEILKDEQEIRFTPDNHSVVQVEREDLWGIYSETGECLVPCQYAVVDVVGNKCMALIGKKYLRPGTWVGDRYLYDLSSKKNIEDLGYGDQFYFERSFSLYPTEPIVKFMDDPIVVTDAAGQIILTLAKNNGTLFTLGVDGRYFYLVGYGDKLNYLYSPRGRFIYEGCYPIHMLAVDTYFLETDHKNQTVQIRNIDGGIAIPFGEFSTLEGNNGYRSYNDICAKDSLIIASVNNKYGVIQLPVYQNKCTDWAEPYVTAAVNQYQLVPQGIMRYYKDNCTREEFCRMLSLTSNAICGKDLPLLAEGKKTAAFTDCDNKDVLAAASLGIVSGTGNQNFSPNLFITREEAAVMLQKACLLFNIKNEPQSMNFSDADKIPDWAVEAIQYVSTVACGDDNRLMKGTGENKFNPKGYYTVEQAITTLVNLISAK